MGTDHPGDGIEIVRCPACAIQEGLCAEHVQSFRAGPGALGPETAMVGLPIPPSDQGRDDARPLPPPGTPDDEPPGGPGPEATG